MKLLNIFLQKLLFLPKAGYGYFKFGLLAFLKFFNSERKILFVTKSGIRTFNLGPVVQICSCIFVVYVGLLFVKSFYFADYMRQKDNELSKLHSINKYFDQEVKGVNVKLQKINQYLSKITSDSSGSADDHNFNPPKKFKKEDLSGLEKQTFEDIRKAQKQIVLIQDIANKRIEKIESAISIAGLTKKISDNVADDEELIESYKKILENKTEGQGGPLLDDVYGDSEIDNFILSEGSLEDQLDNIKFSGEFDYLMTLEKLVEVLPFAKPMKNYYISSGYGTRVDPITNKKAMHRGLDFVGSLNEEVHSPSQGKVILAGKFNDYGNAIVIDHGYGITTRYGHLAKVKVKKGDIVKRGQVIGVQGNTGRSTGPHLHYEVRYKKSPLDPYKFVKAGELLYSNNKKKVKKSNVEG